MNYPIKDSIAIDVNVFEHLMNKQENINNHIHKLLEKFINDRILLLVDDQGKIKNEYYQNLVKYINNQDEDSIERQLLEYFFINSDNQKSIPVKLKDDLMVSITKIIPARKGADRFYVYVAFKNGKYLVTNDRRDMIDESNKQGQKRKALLKNTKKYRPRGANILTSQEAYDI